MHPDKVPMAFGIKKPHIFTYPSPYLEIGMGYFPKDHLSMQIKPANYAN